jgi:hypothetical protein
MCDSVERKKMRRRRRRRRRRDVSKKRTAIELCNIVQLKKGNFIIMQSWSRFHVKNTWAVGLISRDLVSNLIAWMEDALSLMNGINYYDFNLKLMRTQKQTKSN